MVMRVQVVYQSKRATWIQCSATLIVATLVFLVGAPSVAGAQFVPVPPLTSRVVDQTGVLGPMAQELEAQLEALEGEKGSQVAVLVVRTTKPETIEQYGIRVVEQWKLGRQGIDDGALLLVALEDRTVRIEVGRGLEGDIPDAIAKRIISEQIVPQFRSGEIPAGIRSGVESIATVIRGMQLPPPGTAERLYVEDLVLPFFLAFFIGSFLGAAFGRIVGAVASLGIGSLTAALVSPLVVAIPFGVVCGALGFFLRPTFDHGGSGYYGSGRRGHRGDRSGRGGFGGGFSGGGFGGFGGGFSGGGGGFGGGGASGRW